MIDPPDVCFPLICTENPNEFFFSSRITLIIFCKKQKSISVSNLKKKKKIKIPFNYSHLMLTTSSVNQLENSKSNRGLFPRNSIAPKQGIAKTMFTAFKK